MLTRLHLGRGCLIRVVILAHVLPNRQRAEYKWNFRGVRRAFLLLPVHGSRPLILIAGVPRGGVPDQFLNGAAAERIIGGELQQHGSILGIGLGFAGTAQSVGRQGMIGKGAVALRNHLANVAEAARGCISWELLPISNATFCSRPAA